MSIAQRVFKHAKDLTDLEELAKLVANPKAISIAADLARKESQATQDVMDAANEARVLAAQRDAMVSDMKKQMGNLDDAIKSHAARVNEFNAYMESENARLASFSAQLNTCAEEIKAKEAAVASEWVKIEAERKRLSERAELDAATATKREQDASAAIQSAAMAEARYNSMLLEQKRKASDLVKIASEL